MEWQPDSDRLPRAATCFQKIYLPRYTSFSKMRDKMVIAIECMAIVRHPMRSQHPELASPAKRCLGALATVSWPWAPAWGLVGTASARR